MILEMDADFVRAAIKRLETNIEIIDHSNFSPKEKEDLRRSYQRQIIKMKRKLVSFYPDPQH